MKGKKTLLGANKKSFAQPPCSHVNITSFCWLICFLKKRKKERKKVRKLIDFQAEIKFRFMYKINDVYKK